MGEFFHVRHDTLYPKTARAVENREKQVATALVDNAAVMEA